jgi:hypothetical protein
MIRKTKRPADAAASAGPRIDPQRLASTAIDPSNNHSPDRPQASCPADNRGEDDWAYFRARPGAAVRTRFALPGEFPSDFLEHGGAIPYVRVAVVRDDNGLPVWAARSVQFCEGGSA